MKQIEQNLFAGQNSSLIQEVRKNAALLKEVEKAAQVCLVIANAFHEAGSLSPQESWSFLNLMVREMLKGDALFKKNIPLLEETLAIIETAFLKPYEKAVGNDKPGSFVDSTARSRTGGIITL